jgi:Amt family ammonium transporter
MKELNGADMTFVFICAALVMFMIPGLALFYGGMVKSKNVLSTTLHSYAALIVISLQWIIVGYSLAFGPDIKGLIGNLDFVFFNNVTALPNTLYSSTIPQLLFAGFQMMFAMITAAVISGSFAERMRFPAFLIFIVLWSTLVYDPIAYWVWADGGWLRNLGVQDFAGGYVVEINSGISGLIAAIVLGKRKKTTPDPHHIPMAALGGGILWFGWFGFNAGSALAINGISVNVFITTNTAAVAGLVSITPACGYVSTQASLFIGLIAGILSFFAIVYLKSKLGYDDTLDAFGCHGVSGIWGIIATGLFSSKAINSSAVVTFVILKVMSFFIKLRTSKEDESAGLDLSLHGEQAYNNFL